MAQDKSDGIRRKLPHTLAVAFGDPSQRSTTEEGELGEQLAVGHREAPRPAEAVEVLVRARESVLEARRSLDAALRAGRLPGEPLPGEPSPVDAETARELLERAAQWSPRRFVGEARRFRAIYSPLGVLPPDAYRRLVLQATSGCRYGRCSFCALYRDTPHRRRTVAEFREHARRVGEFFGRAIAARSGIFLGEANALEVPAAELTCMLEIAHEQFPELASPAPGGRGGFAAFTDVFDRSTPGGADLERFASLGLRRVYLGAESGDEKTLRRLRKPGRPADVRDRADRLREAGIAVGVIFLAGAGGRRRRRQHVEQSVVLARQLALGPDDIVYVSRLVPPPGMNAFSAPEGSGGSDQPSAEDVVREESELLGRLRGLGARASRYDLAGFVYG